MCLACRVKQGLFDMCPTEEDSGMLMSSVVVNARLCGREVGKRGPSKGNKKRQLTLSMRPARVEVHIFVQRTTISSNGVLFFAFISATYTIYIVCFLGCMIKTIFSFLQVKSKP
jgi:hypothetical protein